MFTFRKGSSPLVVSIPHDGRALMPGQEQDMTDAGLAIPDTDWHVRKLYDFASDLGATVIGANYSRYVVDLNRPADDAPLYLGQLATGLCPQKTFAGDDIYRQGVEITERERDRRVRQYWLPYHQKIRATLDSVHGEFGYALLWDAHSIPSVVPSLFDGVLPDLSVGTNDGASCDERLCDAIMAVAAAADYTSVQNGRFRGGHITRHFGDPDAGIHAVQLELVQKTYMDEQSLEFDDSRADRLRPVLRKMLVAYLNAAEELN